jgi:DHA2 family multidrug resistance protein-like MFS transporter
VVSQDVSGTRSVPGGNQLISASAGRWYALGALGFCVLIPVMDLPLVSIALPTIGRDLHASTAQLQWVLAAFILGSASCTMVAPAIGRRFGMRRTLLAGLVLLGAASAVGATVNSITALITIRALMGIGAGVILPMNIAIIGLLFPQAMRRRAIGISVAAVAMVSPSGPIIGGAIIDHDWWGWIFLITTIMAVVAIPLCRVLLPESDGLPESHGEKAPGRTRGDTLSVALAAAGVTAACFALVEAGARAWVAAGFAAASAVALLAIFIARQGTAAAPLMGLVPFRTPAYLWAQATLSVSHFAWVGVFFAVPLYLEERLGFSALAVGLRLVPLAVMAVVSSLSAERLARRFGAAPCVAAGTATFAVGVGLLALVGHGPGDPLTLTALALVGLGGGLPQAPALTTAMASLPRAVAANAVGFVNAFRHYGGALGAAAIGAWLGTSAGGAGFTHRMTVAMLGIALALLVVATAPLLVARPGDARVPRGFREGR